MRGLGERGGIASVGEKSGKPDRLGGVEAGGSRVDVSSRGGGGG